jgi:hypothetical protein
MDLFDVMDVNEKQRERIAELEQANETWRADFAKLQAENERLRKLWVQSERELINELLGG